MAKAQFISQSNNTIYNSQVAAILFLCTFITRVTSLPSKLSASLGSSSVYALIFLSVIDLVSLFFIYWFSAHNGDAVLTAKNSKIYKLFIFVLMIVLILKGVYIFTLASMFVTTELFGSLSNFIVVAVFFLPILFFALKGLKSISRSAEVFAVFLFLIIMFNILFLKTDIDFSRNLPVLSVDPDQFFYRASKFGFSFGDMLPLLFVKIRHKKLPYISATATIVFVLATLITLIGVAIYGEALRLVNAMIVRLATFSQLSTEIGRMEWTSLFVILIMAVFLNSFIFFGISECTKRLVGSKSVSLVCYPCVLLAVMLLSPSLGHISLFFRQDIGIAFLCFIVLFPATLCALTSVCQTKIICTNSVTLMFNRHNVMIDKFRHKLFLSAKSAISPKQYSSLPNKKPTSDQYKKSRTTLSLENGIFKTKSFQQVSKRWREFLNQ